MPRRFPPLACLILPVGCAASNKSMAALDVCFTDAGGRSVLAKGARPLVTKLSTKTI